MNSFLSYAIFWIAVLACVVAQFGILRATRAESAMRIRAAAPAHRPATRAEEIVWAILPVVTLGIVLALTWHAVHSRALPPAAPTSTVASGGAA